MKTKRALSFLGLGLSLLGFSLSLLALTYGRREPSRMPPAQVDARDLHP